MNTRQNFEYTNSFLSLINQSSQVHKKITQDAIRYAKKHGRGFLIFKPTITKQNNQLIYQEPKEVMNNVGYYTQKELKQIVTNETDTSLVVRMRKTYNDYDPINEFVICFLFITDVRNDIQFFRFNFYKAPAAKYFENLEKQQEILRKQIFEKQIFEKQIKEQQQKKIMSIHVNLCGNPLCNKKSPTKQCSRCKSVKYCNEKCQLSHWNNGHKGSCIAGRK